ncbi:MAG: hypothetical protein ACLT98_02010 [Eggerthellaceae bacterium]
MLQAFIVGGVTASSPDRSRPFISQGGSSLSKLHRHRTAAALRQRGAASIAWKLARAHARHRRTWRNSAERTFERSGPRRPWPPSHVHHGGLLAVRPLVASLSSWCSWRTNTKAIRQQPRCASHETNGLNNTCDGVVWRKASTEDGPCAHVRRAAWRHVVGYYSRSTASQASSNHNDRSRPENFASWSDVVNYLAGINTCNDVALTLNSKIQQAAERCWKATRSPMDPNGRRAARLARLHTQRDVESLLAASPGDSSGGALISRATNALYAPGSTFKLVTLTALLKTPCNRARVEPHIRQIGNASSPARTTYNHHAQRATEVSSGSLARSRRKVGSTFG